MSREAEQFEAAVLMLVGLYLQIVDDARETLLGAIKSMDRSHLSEPEFDAILGRAVLAICGQVH